MPPESAITAEDVAVLASRSGTPIDPARFAVIAEALSVSRSAEIVRSIDVTGVRPALVFDPTWR